LNPVLLRLENNRHTGVCSLETDQNIQIHENQLEQRVSLFLFYFQFELGQYSIPYNIDVKAELCKTLIFF
jgi:hypothetical protein